MGLITRKVKIKWHPNNKEWYESKGYIFTKFKDYFIVNIKDLSKGSRVYIEVKCDCEDCKNPYLKPMKWQNYLRYVKEDGKYYCQKCSNKIFGIDKRIKYTIKNGISFEQWCIDNNRQDALERWDYERNKCKPSEITYSTNKRYYFKCPLELHESEIKNINRFTYRDGSLDCKQCNSFAQYLIDNYGDNALEKYWDYDKNTVNPYMISKYSNKKVFLKCQEKDYHGSYDIVPYAFLNKNRCPYCSNRNGKVHPLDSLGILYPESLKVWSDKNKKSPYEYAPFSTKEVWWKCSDKIHEDYKRIISGSNIYKFRCPECQYSKGEDKISEIFIKNNFIKITQNEYNCLNDIDKINNKYYIPQKEFDGLIGLNNGLLSYDFYLPNYNLLIEYQGQQHEKYIKGFHKSIKDFEKQQEHDKRKRDYTKVNNINLLEIWYWDFDNIEEILSNYLNIYK